MYQWKVVIDIAKTVDMIYMQKQGLGIYLPF